MNNWPNGETAFYTTGQGNAYFDWDDAQEDTPRQLADKFLARFPRLAELGQGADWAYAEWYVQMLGLAEAGILPIAYADWYEAPEPGWLPTTDDSKLPMPPGGEGDTDIKSVDAIGTG